MKQLDYDGFMERQYKVLQEKDKFVSLDEIIDEDTEIDKIGAQKP